MAARVGKRGAFGSRLGFVLAAAGSAIGLGNIWRFPYTVGQHGGGAFIAVYVFCVIVLCLPVLFAELAIGRASQKSPVGAFERLAPGSRWYLVGGLGVVTGFAILAFYSVVAGWTLGYLGKALAGRFAGAVSAEASRQAFGALTGSAPISIALTALFLVLTASVVRGGIQGGIERASKVLMPVFFVLLVTLAIRSVTLPGASAGLHFLFDVDLSKIDLSVIVGALGQALFSLSLGMGAMITYGSYVSHEEKLPGAAISVALADTAIALLAGLIIFPALFATGGDPASGTGLVFVVLPTIFHQLPFGTGFAVAFYALLGIAALTSTISLLEVVVSYFVDELKWSREWSTWLVTGACFLLAIPSAFSGAFLGFQSKLFGNYALAVGAFFICLFVGWKWGVSPALGELARGGQRLPMGRLWGMMVRFVAPLVILVIFLGVAGLFPGVEF